MLDLDSVASVVKGPTIIRATLLCGRALSERGPLAVAYRSPGSARSPELGLRTPFCRSLLLDVLAGKDSQTLFQTTSLKVREPHLSASGPQDDGKGGLGLRGVAFMTVLAVLAVLESPVPSFCLSYKIQCQETTVTVLTVLAVSAVVAVSVVSATPFKLNPHFSSS